MTQSAACSVHLTERLSCLVKVFLGYLKRKDVTSPAWPYLIPSSKAELVTLPSTRHLRLSWSSVIIISAFIATTHETQTRREAGYPPHPNITLELKCLFRTHGAVGTLSGDWVQAANKTGLAPVLTDSTTSTKLSWLELYFHRRVYIHTYTHMHLRLSRCRI